MPAKASESLKADGADRGPPTAPRAATVRGLLLDLDGVLSEDDAVVPGAADALESVTARGLAVRILTNTTTHSRREVASRMAAIGLRADADQIFSPAVAATRFMGEAGVTRIHLAAAPALIEDFTGFELVDRDAEAVVLGDLYRGFTWETLNRLFNLLLDGAGLIALHENRHCRRGGRATLDAGPFVRALEYASGATAKVMGKPSPAFFRMAAADLGLPASAVVIVGADVEADIVGADVEADIAGARRAGLSAIRVRRDRHRPPMGTADVPPGTDLIEGIAELGSWLDRNG